MSHKLIAVVLLLALLALTSGGAAAAPPQPQAAWTVLVYISGDNNLESYVVRDIETELAPAGSSAQVQVLALADRGPGYDTSRGDWTSTKLFHVTQGMLATAENAVADWGERNMGDPQTLLDFVSWARANYPAAHYALYLWGHGWGWRTGYTLRDETDADTLDPDELVAALPSLGFFDVVGYDGCNMATIEVQALWHDYSVATVHSQEYVGMDGIEYEAVLPALQANPAMTADELAIRTNQSAGLNREKTGSAAAVDARWDALVTAVDQWALTLQAGLPANRTKIDRAIRAAQDFWQDPSSADLYDTAAKVYAQVTDPTIRAQSQAVMQAVSAVVLDEWHVKSYSGAHGITIYAPVDASQLDDPSTPGNDFAYYRTLPFAQMTHWDEFLAAFLGQ